MNDPQAIIPLGNATTKHIGVKPEHDAQVPAAQNDMIDTEDLHVPLARLGPLCANRSLQSLSVTSQRGRSRDLLSNPFRSRTGDPQAQRELHFCSLICPVPRLHSGVRDRR